MGPEHAARASAPAFEAVRGASFHGLRPDEWPDVWRSVGCASGEPFALALLAKATYAALRPIISKRVEEARASAALVPLLTSTGFRVHVVNQGTLLDPMTLVISAGCIKLLVEGGVHLSFPLAGCSSVNCGWPSSQFRLAALLREPHLVTLRGWQGGQLCLAMSNRAEARCCVKAVERGRKDSQAQAEKRTSLTQTSADGAGVAGTSADAMSLLAVGLATTLSPSGTQATEQDELEARLWTHQVAAGVSTTALE